MDELILFPLYFIGLLLSSFCIVLIRNLIVNSVDYHKKLTVQEIGMKSDLIQLVKLNHKKSKSPTWIHIKFEDGEPDLEFKHYCNGFLNHGWYLLIADKTFILTEKESTELWDFIRKERDEEFERKIKDRLNLTERGIKEDACEEYYKNVVKHYDLLLSDLKTKIDEK